MNHRIQISGDIALEVDLEGTGMFVAPFPQGGFAVVLSGPPGGPLSFLAWNPLPEERGIAGIEASVRRMFKLPAAPLGMANGSRALLAGAERDALCFVENQGFMNVAWCIASIEVGADNAIVAFCCTAGRESCSCETVLNHPSLRRLADSLQVVA